MIKTTVKNEGFHGRLYSKNLEKEKVVITITGSDGGIKNASIIANFYKQNGIDSLAVGFFKTKETPNSLALIPVEYILNAIIWLKKQGYQKIGIDSLSKGSELALLTAIYCKDVSFMIMRSPSYFVSEGLTSKGQPSGTSCWSYKDIGIDFTGYKIREFDTKKEFFAHKELTLRKFNDDKVINRNSLIQINKISCPILMFSSLNDTVWESEKAANIIMKELNESNQKVSQHKTYKYISHFMLPKISFRMKMLFRIERKYSKKCKLTREEMNKTTLSWIEGV